VVIMGNQGEISNGKFLLITSLVTLITFGLVVALVASGAFTGFDARIELRVFHSDSLFWRTFTSTADAVIALYIVTVPLYYWYNRKRIPLVYTRFIVSLVTGVVLVAVIKVSIGQLRPGVGFGYDSLLDRLRHLHLYAFPSGHTVRATIVGWYISAGREVWVKLLVSIWVLLVGISRIVVGAHWASDVLGGLLLGLFVASSVDYFFNQVRSS
jgi:membrane-associated phospholipid phosphatase